MPKKNHVQKKVDRRVIRTRKAIMDAFDKLACEGHIDKITVSSIAREAKIDRKTFYLHFTSINDLVNQKTEQLLTRVLDKLKAEGGGKTRQERIHIVLSEVNAIMRENVDEYANIVSRVSTDQVLARFEQAAEPALKMSGVASRFSTDSEYRMRLQFYIAGTLSLYASWLKSDRTDPIEKVSDIIENAIEHEEAITFRATRR